MPRGGQLGMLKQLQTLQDDMLKAQEEAAAATVTATAGGGAVSAVVTGERRIQSLSIDPDVVDPEDVEMLQDLIVSAVNQAMRQAQELMQSELSRVVGLPLGSLFGGGGATP